MALLFKDIVRFVSSDRLIVKDARNLLIRKDDLPCCLHCPVIKIRANSDYVVVLLACER